MRSLHNLDNFDTLYYAISDDEQPFGLTVYVAHGRDVSVESAMKQVEKIYKRKVKHICFEGWTQEAKGFFVVGEEKITRIAIARDRGYGGYYLFSCDQDWNVVGDTLHDSAEEAKDSALRIYERDSIDWVKTEVVDSCSEEKKEVESYDIDEPEVDRLIQEHRLLQAMKELRKARPEMSLWEASCYVKDRASKLGID